MGLFNKIFKKPSDITKSDGFFEMLTGYAPVFTNARKAFMKWNLYAAQ